MFPVVLVNFLDKQVASNSFCYLPVLLFLHSFDKQAQGENSLETETVVQEQMLNEVSLSDAVGMARCVCILSTPWLMPGLLFPPSSRAEGALASGSLS